MKKKIIIIIFLILLGVPINIAVHELTHIVQFITMDMPIAEIGILDYGAYAYVLPESSISEETRAKMERQAYPIGTFAQSIFYLLTVFPFIVHRWYPIKPDILKLKLEVIK